MAPLFGSRIRMKHYKLNARESQGAIMFNDIFLSVAPTSPNLIGEALRAWAFKEGYGCYSCFDLIDEFKKSDFNEREFQFLMGRSSTTEGPDIYWGWDDADVFKRAVWFIHPNGIEVGWFWDGDGTLVFNIPGLGTLNNNDCKKDYEWEWINPPTA